MWNSLFRAVLKKQADSVQVLGLCVCFLIIQLFRFCKTLLLQLKKNVLLLCFRYTNPFIYESETPKTLFELEHFESDYIRMTDRNEVQRILTILSWNVNGFNRKRSEVLHHLSLLKADVVFLQETHVGPDRIYSTGSIKVQDLECDYMAAFTVFKGSSRGVAILFKNNLGCGGFNVNCDEKGRFLIISCQIWGHDFVFINVYNSNDEKIKLTDFTQISTYIPHSAYLVVGGDFNTVMDADLDKTSNLRNRSHRKTFDALQCFLENFSLLDVWRCLNPEAKSFTYFDGKGQSRLDYFFLQTNNLTSVSACNIHKRPMYSDKEEYVSDHAPLSIQIQTDGPKWQFDSCLLEDKACMEQLSSIIKTISQINTKQDGYVWPGVKVRLVCEAIAFQRSHPKPSRHSDMIELLHEMDQEGRAFLSLLLFLDVKCSIFVLTSISF